MKILMQNHAVFLFNNVANYKQQQEVIFLPSKKDAKKKKAKAPVDNSQGLYEFANDQLGENKDAAFSDLDSRPAKKQKSSKKKK